MTHSLPLLGTVLPGALLAAALLIVPTARAQNVPGMDTNGNMTGPVVGGQGNGPSRLSAPPALPGARTIETEPAPVDRPPSDMHPNEALFDAINRGDIASARDALGRGADLRATNVLGLTPTELSIDLGRNDITFLLLSLRNSSGNGGSPPVAAGKPVPVRTAAKPPARPARTVVAVRPAMPPAPRQYADVPGTPVPQAGFLGFGGAAR
jgi:hypothetical protein